MNRKTIPPGVDHPLEDNGTAGGDESSDNHDCGIRSSRKGSVIFSSPHPDARDFTAAPRSHSTDNGTPLSSRNLSVSFAYRPLISSSSNGNGNNDTSVMELKPNEALGATATTTRLASAAVVVADSKSRPWIRIMGFLFAFLSVFVSSFVDSSFTLLLQATSLVFANTEDGLVANLGRVTVPNGQQELEPDSVLQRQEQHPGLVPNKNLKQQQKNLEQEELSKALLILQIQQQKHEQQKRVPRLNIKQQLLRITIPDNEKTKRRLLEENNQEIRIGDTTESVTRDTTIIAETQDTTLAASAMNRENVRSDMHTTTDKADMDQKQAADQTMAMKPIVWDPNEPLWKRRQKIFQIKAQQQQQQQANIPFQQKRPLEPGTSNRHLPHFAMSMQNINVSNDPLRRPQNFVNLTRTRLDFQPAVPWLGVLIDAGRHYFTIPWLIQVIDRIADMNYNLIHLRLTDDQTFNVLLDSHPELAYPTAVDNPQRRVYTVTELRKLTAYAKSKGISIMPEINVPGHAGGWAGVENLTVPCPSFTCSRGYGLPLNVRHPDLPRILTDIIREVVDIFDNPPFLHLGGDEVNMAAPCLGEAGLAEFNYAEFELMLSDVIFNAGYPEDQVVRWEMTGQSMTGHRAGAIEHFWESHPGVRHELYMGSEKFFVSSWMYFDTNGDQTAWDVYQRAACNWDLEQGRVPTAIIAGTFELSEQFWYLRNILGRLLAVAMGAANWTLPPPALVAEAKPDDVESITINNEAPATPQQQQQQQPLGATPVAPTLITTTSTAQNTNTVNSEAAQEDGKQKNQEHLQGQLENQGQNDQGGHQQEQRRHRRLGTEQQVEPFNAEMYILDKYKEYCQQLGLGDVICDTQGGPVIPHFQYWQQWNSKWDVWKLDICERMTIGIDVIEFQPSAGNGRGEALAIGNEYLAQHVLEIVSPPVLKPKAPKQRPAPSGNWEQQLQQHSVPLVGIRLDPTLSMTDHLIMEKLDDIVKRYVSRIGANVIQLSIANDRGVVVNTHRHEAVIFPERYDGQPKSPHYDGKALKRFVQHAYNSMGIEVIPEVNIATNVGGWINDGLVVSCPQHYCAGKPMPHDVITAPLITPFLASFLGDVRREIFTTSRYMHLGANERAATIPCFQEAKLTGTNGKIATVAAFEKFERTLSKALEITGLLNSDTTEQNVLRWENAEHEVYGSRVGSITQYRANTTAQKIQSLVSKRNEQSFFVTVDLLVGDAWDVYQVTQRLVELKPTAIIADTHTMDPDMWKEFHIPQRMLAFAIGASNYSRIDKQEEFLDLLQTSWHELSGDEEFHVPLKVQNDVDDFVGMPRLVKQQCERRTAMRLERYARVATSYYNGTDALSSTWVDPAPAPVAPGPVTTNTTLTSNIADATATLSDANGNPPTQQDETIQGGATDDAKSPVDSEGGTSGGEAGSDNTRETNDGATPQEQLE